MQSTDYIVRMIEELAAAIARIVSLRRAGNVVAAEIEVENAYQAHLGIDPDRLRALSLAELDDVIRTTLEESGEAALAITTLLTEEALLALDASALSGVTSQAIRAAERAIVAWVRLLTGTGEAAGSDEQAERVEHLISSVASHPVDRYTIAVIAAYYEHTGAFGSADDLLVDLAQSGGAEDRERLIHFYERLLRQPDDLLAHGNLPRAEVYESLAALRRMTP